MVSVPHFSFNRWRRGWQAEVVVVGLIAGLYAGCLLFVLAYQNLCYDAENYPLRLEKQLE
jgi:hypothetical protein